MTDPDRLQAELAELVERMEELKAEIRRHTEVPEPRSAKDRARAKGWQLAVSAASGAVSVAGWMRQHVAATATVAATGAVLMWTPSMSHETTLDPPPLAAPPHRTEERPPPVQAPAKEESDVDAEDVEEAPGPPDADSGPPDAPDTPVAPESDPPPEQDSVGRPDPPGRSGEPPRSVRGRDDPPRRDDPPNRGDPPRREDPPGQQERRDPPRQCLRVEVPPHVDLPQCVDDVIELVP